MAIAVAPSAIVAAEAVERCLTGAEGIAVAPSVIGAVEAVGRMMLASAVGVDRTGLMF